jgi:transcriptional regulator with XRE-family HTH domain
MSSPKNTPSSTEETFANRLQSLRELRGITQAELGRKAGMAAASISHFETGQRTPSLDSLVKLADALEVTTDAMLGRSNSAATVNVDPIFLRASRTNAQTLDTLKRVTAAILAGTENDK